MWWKLLQVIVFVAVLASDWIWHWGDGGSQLAVNVCALAAAWIVTAIPFAIRDLFSRSITFVAKLRRAPEQPGNHRIEPSFDGRGAGEREGRSGRDHPLKLTDRSGG